MEKRQRLFLVDDHQLLRNTLRLFLETKASYVEVVGEADNGADAVKQILLLQPDIVLMDISLPDWDGIAVTEHLAKKLPNTKIIAVTMHTEEAYLMRFLQAGGCGYIHKSAADKDLLIALEKTLQGEIFLSDRGVQVMASQFRGAVSSGTKPSESQELDSADMTNPQLQKAGLSDRELQVLQLICHGYGYKEIGEKLFVSVSTVQTYKCRICEKLSLSKKAELIQYAVENHMF